MAAKLYERAFVCATSLHDPALIQQICDAKDCPKKMITACRAYLATDQQQPADNRPDDW